MWVHGESASKCVKIVFFINFAIHVKNIFKHLLNAIYFFLQLRDGQDFPLKKSQLQTISDACTTTFLPKDFASVLVSIPPLKNALKLLYLKELQEQSKSFCKKKEDPSILRVGSKCYQELVSFSWAKLLTEWHEKAPDVLDALTAIAVPENSLSRPKRADAIVPPLCMAFSTLLNTRNAELSLVQKMVSVVVGLGGCSKMVCMLYLNSL